MSKNWLYRISQFVSLLLGIRIFVLILFTFTLYVSTFFLFNQEDSLRDFVFDFKVQGIIFCSMLSIAAGGIINRFYDFEKDRVQKPFRMRLQSFLKQEYFLYTYLAINMLSLAVAVFFSFRIFLFFLIYQFVIWFYSHKISKIAILNNLTYVAITLYPFFGMLVYFQHFSVKLFWMSAFLFFILWIIDLMKDILTIRSDKIFGYQTVPLVFGLKITRYLLMILLLMNAFTAYFISYEVYAEGGKYLVIYFLVSMIVMLLAIVPLVFFKIGKVFWLMTMLRLWVFVGVVSMLLNGIFLRM